MNGIGAMSPWGRRLIIFKNAMKALKNSNFIIKLSNWEYWPIWAVYFPIFIYYFYLSIKARSFFFLTAANPAIENGGFGGDEKVIFLDQLPAKYTPKSILVNASISADEIIKMLEESNLNYPLIIKPNQGQRGWLVEKIYTQNELESYLSKYNNDFLIQEYIDYEEEYAVLYYKYPNQDHGSINSVCKKEFLTVSGNGVLTLEELIKAKPRAKLQFDTLKFKYQGELANIIPLNHQITLSSIGNHCKGTIFLDYNHLINEQMISTFEEITKNLEGVFFCRYDLKCKSEKDLYTGKDIKIIEVNGVGAEPAHIYDPKNKIIKAWKDLVRHWKIIYKISEQNKARGFKYPTLAEASVAWKKYKSCRRAAN